MTSTLPELSTNPLSSIASAIVNLSGHAAVAGPGAVNESETPSEFATVLSATPGGTPPISDGIIVPMPPVNGSQAVPGSARLVGNLLQAPIAPALETPDLTHAGRRSGQLSNLSPVLTAGEARPLVLAEVEFAEAHAPVDNVTAGAGSHDISRDRQEEAVAFVVTMMQALLPGIPLPRISSNSSAPVVPPTEVAVADPIRANQYTPSAKSALFQPTIAGDGAFEFNLDISPPQSALPESGPAPGIPLKIQAELAIEGQPIARLQTTALVAQGAGEAAQNVKAIFAGKNHLRKNASEIDGVPTERIFLVTEGKLVESMSPAAGITVAKLADTMPAAPIEEIRHVRTPDSFSGLWQRGDFPAAQPPAESGSAPANEAAGKNLAERAVETVTNLMENQFSARMEKSGSVHLRLNFGDEDLSVRVKILNGVVHTDFRTDSPELRNALAYGWQGAFAQSRETMVRYLDPVFSASPSPGEESATADHSPRQFSQEHSSRSPREAWPETGNPFARRSHLNESFIPEPTGLRRPALLPTTLRLSALA